MIGATILIGLLLTTPIIIIICITVEGFHIRKIEQERWLEERNNPKSEDNDNE